MTDEELDEATAREAWRKEGNLWAAVLTAARLGREGWKPEDPLLVEAREIVAAAKDPIDAPAWRGNVALGYLDGSREMKVALAAIRRGIDIGKGEMAPASKSTEARRTIEDVL